MIKQYVEDFEQMYKKINRIFYLSLIAVSILLLFVGRINILLTIFLGILLVFISINVRNILYNKNTRKIGDKLHEDFEVDFSISVLELLLQNKKRNDYTYILFLYLYALTLGCQFEKFREVYLENRECIKKHVGGDLEFFLELFLSLQSDRSEYKRIIFQYTFSPYHNVDHELSGVKAHLRHRDRLREIAQLYELEEYQKTIEKIDGIQFRNKLEAESYEFLKKKCLYNEMFLKEI